MNPLDAAAGIHPKPFTGFSHARNVSDIVAASDECFQTLRTPFAPEQGCCAAVHEPVEKEPVDQVNSAWRPIERAININ
jgi:hypothetical protein